MPLLLIGSSLLLVLGVRCPRYSFKIVTYAARSWVLHDYSGWDGRVNSRPLDIVSSRVRSAATSIVFGTLREDGLHLTSSHISWRYLMRCSASFVTCDIVCH